MADPTTDNLIAALTAFVQAKAPAPVAAGPLPAASTSSEAAGNAQSNAGDGALPAITSVKILPGELRLSGNGGWKQGQNVALVSPTGNHDRGYPLTVGPGGVWALTAEPFVPGELGMWQARITDPVTYATSPWFGFVVS